MTDPLFGSDDDATPLSPDEIEGLIPSFITLRQELNEAEQQGIETAERWAFARRRNVLDVPFLRRLHQRMFKDVWRWAGEYRTTGKNIGIDAWKIPTELLHCLDDIRYWIENETFPADEIATRFHHRLVWIHAFPNGNGRHARMAADLLAVQLGRSRFTWGRVNLVNASETRRQYIAALRAADQHDIEPLLQFLRS